MTDIDKDAILAEMMEFSGIQRQRPGDVTVKDFQQHAGISIALASRLLRQMVEAGHYTEHRVILDTGHMGAVYRPTKAAG